MRKDTFLLFFTYTYTRTVRNPCESRASSFFFRKKSLTSPRAAKDFAFVPWRWVMVSFSSSSLLSLFPVQCGVLLQSSSADVTLHL
jgi:hypothetical protein